MAIIIKKQLISSLLVLSLGLSVVLTEQFESAQKCEFKRSKNNDTLTLNCTNRQMSTVLGEWPEDGTYKNLVAVFSYNNINRLENLASSKAHDLKIVYSHCNIKELSTGIISDSVNVTYLDLSYNQITSEQLRGNIFKGPYNNTVFEPIVTLKHLNLAYNQIHMLHKNIFEHTPNLEELNLEGNDFKVIDIHTAVAFGDIKNLKTLNLANNELLELAPTVVKYFKNLTKLDLSHNDLQFVPDSLGMIGKSLRVLKLDFNPILELDGNSFLGLGNLTHLYMNNMHQLIKVKTNTFAHLYNLKRLEISHNSHLDEIEDEAFGKIQNLKELQLSSNNLTSLHPLLINWTEIKVLNISGNPFFCTCELYNITTQLSEEIKTNSRDVPMCWDIIKPSLMPLYSIGKETCITEHLMLQRSSKMTDTNMKILRMSVVTSSVILFIVLTAASVLLYMKWRSYKRNRSYPFASQVIYNPITTDIRI